MLVSSDVADAKIGVIGLGYVGLPLAVEFGKSLQFVDLGVARIHEFGKP